MKKYLHLVIGVLFFVLLALPVTRTDAQSSILSGQIHKYDVHLRTNGEAVITGRITFTNNETEPQENLKLSIEGQPTELYVAQIVRPKKCARYDDSVVIRPGEPRGCLEYSEPDYAQFYSYGNDRTQYFKLNPEVNGTEYTLPLNTQVQPNKDGAIVFAYATKSYVTSGIGNKSFDIPTIKVNQRIQEADVAVTFDEDVYYDGKKASTQYKSDVSTGLSSLSANASAGSESLDRGVSNIGSYGALEKHANSLAPGDVFHTKGTYATSWIGMYYKWLLLGLLGIVGLIACVWFIARWQEKGLFRKRAKEMGQPIKGNTQDVSILSDDAPDDIEDDETQTSPLLISRHERDTVAATKNYEPKLFGASTNTNHIYIFNVRLTPYFAAFILSLVSLVTSIIISLGLAYFVSVMAPSYTNSIVEYISMYSGVAVIVVAFIATFTAIPVWIIRRRGWRLFYVYLICLAIWLMMVVMVLKPFISSGKDDSYRRYPYDYDILQ